MNAKFSDSVREGLGLYGTQAVGMTSGVLLGLVRLVYRFFVTMSAIGIVVCGTLALCGLTSWSHFASMLFWNVSLVVGRHVLSTWGLDQLNRLFAERPAQANTPTQLSRVD